jgi:HPt (histidine-containing phosphotransfer) domain-containing protein
MGTPAIDLSTYNELKDTAGAEFVVELVDTFVDEAPGMLAELRSARAASDADRFRRAAHSIKSNANTFGALALGTLARELELKGLAAEPAGDGPAIDALAAELARACAELKGLCHG